MYLLFGLKQSNAPMTEKCTSNIQCAYHNSTAPKEHEKWLIKTSTETRLLSFTFL